jgi:DNA adenine methylase
MAPRSRSIPILPTLPDRVSPLRAPQSALVLHSGFRASPSAVRPFLKWAGGKRQLLPVLRTFYPVDFGRYFEPFVGSGAVFFDLAASGRLDRRRVFLSDSNADLIGCYLAVRDYPEAVIHHLEHLANGHAADPAGHFYDARERFNEARLAGRPGRRRREAELAAMLIYLNRTAFNGLFRLNRKGRFNVPAGRYANPRIANPELVRQVSFSLGRAQVSIALLGFEAAARRARAGDFLYFDPPYAPLTPTSSFTGYTGRPFTLDDQARLRDVAVSLALEDCHVMVSNSSAPAVAALYEEATQMSRGRLVLHRLAARRAINSRPGARGPVTELLLTTLTPQLASPPDSSRR